MLPAGYDQANPNWTPDGKVIFFGDAAWVHQFARGFGPIRRLDLPTRTVSVVPGSEELWAPKLSPDGRFLAAQTLDSHSLKLFDFQTGKWTDLATVPGIIGYPCWTRDSKAIYFNSGKPAIYRVDRASRKLSLVANLPGIQLTGNNWQWFGLTPDDSPLFLRDASIQDVYALDVRFP